MNYWLINPKNYGSDTNLSDLKSDCIYMGWEEKDCPKFYNDVKKNDVIIVAEGSHSNTKVHFIGIAEKLDKGNQCWRMLHSTQDKNKDVANIIRNSPNDFGGGLSPNPWGPTRSIIKLNDNPAENTIKLALNAYFREVKMKEKLQQYAEFLTSAHNLIFTGAPGTGKTYLAQQIAKEMGCSETCVGFVQFHPSYDYTDFVEGLRPKQDEGGNIGFEPKDGIFKKFCENALLSYLSKVENAPKYVFIIDEINRGEISKIFGELFFSLDSGYRVTKEMIDEHKSGKSPLVTIRTQYANMCKQPNAFDKALGITNENDYGHFFVPNNVYIIGTMNDIDRSVESMDFAMRRRFAFKEILASDRMEMIKENDDLAKYFQDIEKHMKNLNLCILTIQGFSTAYQIGAAYFLKLKNYLENGEPNWESLWTNHLYGLLFEYLRGLPNMDDDLNKLRRAYFLDDTYEEKDGKVTQVETNNE